MKFTQKIGFILLAIYLIIAGLTGVIGLSFQGMHVLLGGLMIAAGIFILIDR
jgi:hypothetical protein